MNIIDAIKYMKGGGSITHPKWKELCHITKKIDVKYYLIYDEYLEVRLVDVDKCYDFCYTPCSYDFDIDEILDDTWEVYK